MSARSPRRCRCARRSAREAQGSDAMASEQRRDPAISRRIELTVKLAVLGLFLMFPALVAFSVWREASYQAIGEPVEQPIPFSHKHHAGDDGIDCRYCHTTVEKSAFAGLPSSGICLSCHSQLYTDQSVLAALRESVASGK